MKTNETDSNFQQLFHELKQQDAASVPLFARLTRAPKRPAHALPRWLVPAAALVLVGVSLSLFRRLPPQLEREAQRWAAFSTWETPTDALLDVASWTPSAAPVGVPNAN